MILCPKFMKNLLIFLLVANSLAAYTTFQNTPLEIPESGNICDFESISSQGGSIVLNSDGNFKYTPPFKYVGLDTFRYTRLEKEEYEVSIEILPVSPPTDFIGVIKKCHLISKKIFKVEATWKPSDAASFYRVYLSGRMIGEIKEPRIISKCFTTRKAAKCLEISAVNAYEGESERVKIQIDDDTIR